MSSELSTPDYWNTLYLTNDAGWDKGQASPPIVRMLSSGLLAPKARIAVLGAGRGHEAIAAAQLGFQVTAIDFAPEAAKAMREARDRLGLTFEVLEGDLFDLPRTHSNTFDAAIEHTCFCAIDPARRAEYVQAIHTVLVPKGVLLGLFYAHDKPGGPPYLTDEAEVTQLFSKDFEFSVFRRAPDSFENRAGNELEFVFRKKN